MKVAALAVWPSAAVGRAALVAPLGSQTFTGRPGSLQLGDYPGTGDVGSRGQAFAVGTLSCLRPRLCVRVWGMQTGDTVFTSHELGVRAQRCPSVGMCADREGSVCALGEVMRLC